MYRYDVGIVESKMETTMYIFHVGSWADLLSMLGLVRDPYKLIHCGHSCPSFSFVQSRAYSIIRPMSIYYVAKYWSEP